MPPKSKPLSELGNVDESENAFRAHVKYRNGAGQQVNFYGPRREHRSRAETDLAQMRAAGAIGTTREQGLQYMAAEARRLQVSASFEAEVRTAVQRQRAAEEEDEADAVYMNEEEPVLKSQDKSGLYRTDRDGCSQT